jgi:eukaryotic-like serine/threonine-protein kinase
MYRLVNPQPARGEGGEPLIVIHKLLQHLGRLFANQRFDGLNEAFRRNKVSFAAAGAVALALVLGAMVSTWLAVEAARARSQAQTNEQKALASQANEARLLRQSQIQELAARRRAYASDINLVQQALAVNNLGRAQLLLNRQRPQPGEPDLRGWEWRYLWQDCRSDALFHLCQRTNPITSLSVSHDGKWIAVGENDNGGLSIWDAVTRHEATNLSTGASVVRLAFSPREPLLAYSCVTSAESPIAQFGVRLWNVEDQVQVGELHLDGNCLGLTFSEDGRILITESARGSQDTLAGQISLWQIPGGTLVTNYPVSPNEQDEGTGFAVAHDLSVAAYSVKDNLGEGIRLLNLADGGQRWRQPAADPKGQVLALALSPNSKLLASGEGFLPSPIRLWDVKAKTNLARLEGHRGWVSALLFFPDGKILASSSSDQTIRLWDCNGGSWIHPSPSSFSNRLRAAKSFKRPRLSRQFHCSHSSLAKRLRLQSPRASTHSWTWMRSSSSSQRP